MSVLLITCMFFVTGVLSSNSYCKWERVCPAKSKTLKNISSKSESGSLKYAGPVITVPKVSDKEIKDVYLRRSNDLPDVSVRMPSFLVDPVEVTCKSTEFARNIRMLRKKIKCTPRYVLVDVVSDEGRVIPNKVATKLCSGLCVGEKACVATEYKNLSLSVRVEMDNGQIKCSTISVPEDLKCKCGCEQNKGKPCTPSQIYMKKNCRCECKNEKDFYQCLEKSKAMHKHKWDPDKCACVCKEHKLCTTGSYWNEDQCRCKI